MNSSLFELRGVSYHYGRLRGLENISLSIARGARVALLGANGSGKSTLLRVLDALYTPDAGELRFDGDVLTESKFSNPEFAFAFRRRVALLFQDPDVQLFNPTVFDEIAFAPLQLRWPRDQIRRAVMDVMDQMEISGLSDRAPYHLSGGEKKRVALASLLVYQPEVLLLDEPTSALDPRSQAQLLRFLEGLPPEKTCITATHDLAILERIATTCYVLEAGAITAEGSPAEILNDVALLQRANLR